MQINLRNLILAACLGALSSTMGLTGCVNTEGRTAGRFVDDVQINRRVENALENDPVYKFEGVQADTYRGVTQLSGWVVTEAQKQRAAELARRVEGPVDVINNIALKPPPLMPTGREQPYQQQPQQQQQQQRQPQQPPTTR